MERTALRKLLGVILLALAQGSHAERVPLPVGDGHFTAESLMRGVRATAAECAAVEGAVWARSTTGEQECIRYWLAGDAGSQRRVLVYIPGDQISRGQPEPGYTARSPRMLHDFASSVHARLGVPYVLLSRPGIFGSSGDHGQRRREPEPRLVSAALDEIKARHGVSEFVLVGLSGGGHIVASLLAWRPDIVCAVAASSVSSPRQRWRALGLDRDVTGFDDSHEPVDQLRRGDFHPRLRVFVLGDPQDRSVPWSTQLPLAVRLRELGVETHVLEGEGTGPDRHVLGNSAQLLGAQCLQDRPTPAILDLASRGLKG